MLLLKSLLPTVLDAHKDWKFQLLQNWHTIMGSLKTRVRLEKIFDTTLVIGVYEIHWMQELFLLSKVLLDSINKSLDKPRITQLKFKLVEESRKKQPHKTQSVRGSKINFKLTAEQKRALARLQDKELGTVLESFLMRCLENT